jgi:Rrf2 family protein
VLSNTADYALRAMLVLARAYGRRPMRADEIAAATVGPRNYLAKTLNALAKAGLVVSARGPTGGFALAAHPTTLTIAAVVDCFDEPRVHTRCLLGTGPCDPARACAAHHRWTAIEQARRSPLLTTTLAELIGGAPLPDAVAVVA